MRQHECRGYICIDLSSSQKTKLQGTWLQNLHATLRKADSALLSQHTLNLLVLNSFAQHSDVV